MKDDVEVFDVGVRAPSLMAKNLRDSGRYVKIFSTSVLPEVIVAASGNERPRMPEVFELYRPRPVVSFARAAMVKR